MRMNRTFARILSLALCLILTVGLLPATVLAAKPDGNGGNTVMVTFSGNNFTVKSAEGDDIGMSVSVNKNNAFSFRIVPNAGYDDSAMVVTNGGAPLEPDADGIYTISSPKRDPDVSVTGLVKKTYTVSFSAGNGTGTMEPAAVAHGDSYELPACGFIAPEGQQFKLWSVDGVEKGAGENITVTGNTAVTAVWETIPANSYPVHFDANGGTGSMADISVESGKSCTLPVCGFTAPAGRQFGGWLVDGVTLAAGTSITVNAEMTVKALWVVQTFQITFDANGGTGSMTPVSLRSGEVYTLPVCEFAAPTGYQFRNWLVDGAEVVQITVTANTTVTAQWKAVCICTEKCQNKNTTNPNCRICTADRKACKYANTTGNSYLISASAGIGCTVTASDGSALPASIKKGDDLIFRVTIAGGYQAGSGFAVTHNGTPLTGTDGVYTISNVQADVSIAVSGVEQITYTVTFDANGGGGAMAAQTGVVGTYTVPACTFTAPEGQQFAGWLLNGTTYQANNTIQVTGPVTLTAQWENKPVVTYTISYDLGGGALAEGVTNPISYTVESGAITLNNPAKFGYTFLGWTDGNSSEPVTSVTIPAGSTGDRTYTAHWQQVTYSVTGDDYTRNEDNSILFTAQADFSKFETGGKVLVDDSELRRDVDYTAVSGSTKVTLNKSFLDTLSIGEHTLTIQFNDGGKAETKFNVDAVYTVTFDANGGQLKSPATGTVKHGEKLAKPADPTHASMKFNAWYRYEGGSYSLYNFDNPVTGNLELVAQWTNYSSTEYQVTFLYKDDGKTPDLSLRTDVYTCQLPSGSFPADPFRDGYTFKGWYLADDVTGEIQEPGVSVGAGYTYTKATKVAAKWEPITYEIKYLANNGTDQSKTVSVKYDEVHRVLHGTADCNFDSSGKVFKNWTVTPDGIGSGDAYEAGDEVSKMAVFEGDKFTLYAQWEDAPTYTVAYEANGGSGTMTPDTGVSGSYTIRANGFTAPVGYRFKGWQIGTTAYASGETITVSDNVTITALWEQIPVNPPVTYTVRFDANGGTGTMADMTFTGGEAKNLTQNSFTRSGCTFKGWNTRADGSGTPYADKASVSALSTTDGAVVTLYAQWEENSSGTPGSPNPGGSNSGSSSSGLDYVPRTGDISGLMLWLTIALASAVALVADIFTRRRAR